MSRPNKLIYYIIGLIIIAGLLLFFIFSDQNQGLKVFFLDVGQGDAILIQAPGNIDVLIDAGPGNKVIADLDKHLPFWNREIELMILTHPHSDHIQGLTEVLKRYKVDKVIGYKLDYSAPDYLEWLKIIEEKNIPFIKTVSGDQFNLGDNIYLETLYPLEDITGQEFDNLNLTSIVAELHEGSYSYLFTGDSPAEVEKEMMSADLIRSVDVLKVGHHGSKYSSALPFLEKLSPAYAVIQVGKNNSFGHPHLITLQRLKKLGARILRNDLDGEIACEVQEKEVVCQ
ncbi:MAG: ComEC/Rec2 family competence protein [Patescibacteria group bacterium]